MDLEIISNEKLEKIAEEFKNIDIVQKNVEEAVGSMFDDIEEGVKMNELINDFGIFNRVESQIVESIQFTLDNMAYIIKTQNDIIKILCENKGVILKNEVAPEIDTSKENNMIKSEQDSFTLYLVTYDCDSAEGEFSDYAIYNDPGAVASFADNTRYDRFPKAVIICEIVPYSNGAVYVDVRSDYLYKIDKDIDKDDFYEYVNGYSDMVDTNIEQVYTFERRGGEEGFIHELSISIDKKYILEAFVTRVIERLKESEINIISRDNEWLLMYISSKTINLSAERHLVTANSFDGETLEVSISDGDIAEELEKICKSKNIKLICN